MKLLLLLLAFSVSTLTVESASVITIYNQTFQYGAFKAVSVSGCTNLSPKWRDETSAVDLHDTCFILYSEVDCRGKRVTLQTHHKKYTDNLNTIGFGDVTKSVSECGFKIRPGYHLLRSVMDGSVVSLVPMKDDFFATVLMRPWNKSPRQVWSVGKYGPRVGVNYGLRPLNYQHYNPITYQTFEPRAGSAPYMPERFFDIKALPGSKYSVKILHSDKCLVNRGVGKPVGKTNCAPWLANQQFNFIPVQVRGNDSRFEVQPIYPIPILL